MAHQPMRNERADQIRREMVQTTIRFGIVIAILLAFLYGFPQLPGTEREVLELTNYSITVGTVGYGLITLFVYGAILSYATSIGSLLGERFEFRQIERIVQLIALLGVVIWANQVFYWLPYFEANPGQYDLLFLILGIGVAGWLGFVLYRNADEVSELFTRKVITDDSRPEQIEPSQGTDRGMQRRRHGNQTDGGVDRTRQPGVEPNTDRPDHIGTRDQPPQEPLDPDRRQEQRERDQSRIPQAEPNRSQPPQESPDTGVPKSDSDDETAPSSVETEPESDRESENECPECEEILPEEAKFCHNCGSNIGNKAE